MNRKRWQLLLCCLLLFVVTAALYSPVRFRFLLRKAKISLEKKERQDAEKYLLQAIRLKPKDAETNYQLCRLYHEQKRYEKSVDYCRKTIAYDPKLSAPYLNMAELYFEMGELDYAVTYLEQLMRLDRNHANGWFLLGRIAVQRNQRTQAKMFLQNAQLSVEKNPNPALEKAIQAALRRL